MTTYELIRQLVKLDPTGDMDVMLSIRFARTNEDGVEVDDEAVGFIQSMMVERPDDTPGFLILESTDM